MFNFSSSDPSFVRAARIDHCALLFSVLGLPLVGALFAGTGLKTIFRFPPPLEIPGNYLRFSWFAAGAIVVILSAIAASWAAGARASLRGLPAPEYPLPGSSPAASSFPWWGGTAISWTLCWWGLAWTRLPVFETVQRYTFFPLWIGFVLVANAVVQQRTGSCLMIRSPKCWLSLFGASAFFWWVFEWLNRFVHNWHYLGVAGAGPVEYVVHATLCFSTVLPAVAAVAETLNSFSSWVSLTRDGPAWPWLERRSTAVILLMLGVGALLLTGTAPQQFYPALWAAPLALALGTSILRRRHGLAHEIARGDWHRAATWMTAALICGFFWELWNWRSFVKWIYTVPGVDRWHVFEMPLLGYAGYLPFGCECLLVFELLGRSDSTEKLSHFATAEPRS